VARDGLDSCVYAGISAPPKKAPPKVKVEPRPQPGEEYETATPPPSSTVAEPEAQPAEPTAILPAANEPAPAPAPTNEAAPVNAI
jgi:monofunctional biosynthetic peptidoglycan transglycosylase